MCLDKFLSNIALVIMAFQDFDPSSTIGASQLLTIDQPKVQYELQGSESLGAQFSGLRFQPREPRFRRECGFRGASGEGESVSDQAV